jgi:hypothetical protein
MYSRSLVSDQLHILAVFSLGTDSIPGTHRTRDRMNQVLGSPICHLITLSVSSTLLCCAVLKVVSSISEEHIA